MKIAIRAVAFAFIVLLSLASARAQDLLSFTQNVNGVSHIFTWQVGSQYPPTQLTFGSLVDAGANWSFDGTTLVYQHGYAVYTIPSGGGTPTLLSTSDGAGDILPSFATNGQILFSSVILPVTGIQPNTSLMLMNVDGTGRTTLVASGSPYSVNLAPFMSPDGTKISFECGPYNGAPLQVCLITKTGSAWGSPVLLTNYANCVSADAHWNSASNLIIYNSTCPTNAGVNLWSILPTGISAVTGATWNSANTVSFNFASAPGATLGMTLTFSGFTPSNYNGTYNVTQINGTSITATGISTGNLATNPGTPSVEGSLGPTQVTFCVEPQECNDASYDWPHGNSPLAYEVGFGSSFASNANAPAEIWMFTSDGNFRSTYIQCTESGCHPQFKPVVP